MEIRNVMRSRKKQSKKVVIIILFVFIASWLGYRHLARNIILPVMTTNIETVFLSKEYFAELSTQYTKIRSEHRKWFIFDHSKAIAANAILIRMMSDLEDHPEALRNHTNFDLFFETFDRHVRKLPYITEELHYFRNELNQYGDAPEHLDEMIELAACGKWQLFGAKYHRYEVSELDAAYYVKFISANGRFEAVYHTETGQIVTDSVNMGTYNYAPFSIWKFYEHHQYDKVPWMKWGNTEQVPYEEISLRKSRHGTLEQKNSTHELQQLIKKKSETRGC